MSKPKVAAIGECMLELSAPPGGPGNADLRMGFGGDTLNTAIYLSRLGVATDYVTVLGDDSCSDWMLASWQREGVGTSLVSRLPGRLPGLYMIETDAGGERRFNYWRREAPARDLFADKARVESLQASLAQADMVYFSGISLSLYGEPGRERLFGMLQALREHGVKIAFDGNYRPAGWPDAAVARTAFTRACELADIVLPTYEDEQALFADTSPQATIARIRDAGAAEVVLKRGPAGCTVAVGGESVDVPAMEVARPIDTTAAGDSFNAGYLAGRLLGKTPAQAARQGHQLAAQVIQCRGAILPLELMPRFNGESAG